MNIDEIKNEHYYCVIPDKAYWSPTIQRLTTITPNPDLVIKVTSHCDDPCLPLIFGNVINTFSNQSPKDTKFELALLAEDLIKPYVFSYPESCPEFRPEGDGGRPV